MWFPSLGVKVISTLSVNVKLLADGNIYPALKRGTIDATEWVGSYEDKKLGFCKVAKNYYYPDCWELGIGLSFYINKDAWNQLPDHYKAIVEAVYAYANVDMQAKYYAKNPEALERMINQGVKLRKF